MEPMLTVVTRGLICGVGRERHARTYINTYVHKYVHIPLPNYKLGGALLNGSVEINSGAVAYLERGGGGDRPSPNFELLIFFTMMYTRPVARNFPLRGEKSPPGGNKFD
jgi:hypothetical protein